MLLQQDEDARTLRNIGVNVGILVGVTLILIVGSILLG